MGEQSAQVQIDEVSRRYAKFTREIPIGATNY